MAEIEIVYVTTSRNDQPGGPPKRRALPYELGDPLPRIGESVIIEFDGGAPSRWIVQDVAHVIEHGRHDVVVRLAPPFSP